ncbi:MULTISPECIES: hypothetical protein [Lysinibacillus]|uniref:hypothetical protein n=1 Tax=Lysinibacillus TaxID=400634 RepID=UPI00214C632F|nr:MULTISPECIES: hypothetical protein [Lysinibacillus]UUV26380.1 hypothetical protein NP781_07185 [Lysinibacillus sp. FN11]UYB49261.1 hypothetical protein OCI51_09935 [Lysinibacillus capsici]
MAEFSNAGYHKIRDYIKATWNYIELQDETGTAIIRLGIDDSRVTWIHTENTNPLKIQIKIKGSEISLPKRFAKSAIFDVASGGTALAVSDFETTTLTQEIDELTVEHSLEVPNVQ